MRPCKSSTVSTNRRIGDGWSMVPALEVFLVLACGAGATPSGEAAAGVPDELDAQPSARDNAERHRQGARFRMRETIRVLFFVTVSSPSNEPTHKLSCIAHSLASSHLSMQCVCPDEFPFSFKRKADDLDHNNAAAVAVRSALRRVQTSSHRVSHGRCGPLHAHSGQLFLWFVPKLFVVQQPCSRCLFVS